jgi:hypothetical protein
MTKANAFQQLGASAIEVLARLEAKKQVKEHLRAQGIRLTYVPARQIVARTKAHLQAHPELYEQALQRAWEMGVSRKASRSSTCVTIDDAVTPRTSLPGRLPRTQPSASSPPQAV